MNTLPPQEGLAGLDWGGLFIARGGARVMPEVMQMTDAGWKPPVSNRIKLYRLGSNRTYRMVDLPYGRETVTVNLEKEFLNGYMTEPAFKRIQEATGNLFVEEKAGVDTRALAAIAARNPELPQVTQTPTDVVVTQPEPKRRGRKPKAERG